MQGSLLIRFGKKFGAAVAVATVALLTQNCGGGGSNNNNPHPPPGGSLTVTLATVASGFVNPLGLVAANDNSNRLFVLEQQGTIRIIQNGSVVATPFLDLRPTTQIESGDEKGLLGMALHPQFAQNRRFYLNYTRRIGTQLQTVIAEYLASAANPNQASSTERILFTVDQPFDNHNGGQLAFGPDGFLYIGLGDGGSAGDPRDNGQTLQTLLGKILRIDVNGNNSSNAQYGIPADNPFASGANGAPEIWAFGLRNPWRFSFDTNGGRLFAGDVGQDNFEEVDIITRGGNFGWRIMEGAHCFNPATGCNQNGLILPIAEYSHSEGSAVIGGFVYRGSAIPLLQGSYVFGDLTSHTIWRLVEASPTWTRSTLLSSAPGISSFGQDLAGELYVLDYNNGAVLRISP